MPDNRYETLLGEDIPAAIDETPETDADVDTDLETDSPDGDASTEDAAEDETSSESSDSDEAPADADTTSVEAQTVDPLSKDRGDERTLPKWCKELIKEKPQLASVLKALHFGNQRYSKFGTAPEFQKYKTTIDNFGGIDNVLKAKARLDTLGGEVGLDELQQELNAFRDLDKDWREQPAAFVDRLIENNAENYTAMMPTALIKWAQKDFPSYAHVIAQGTVNTLAQNGMLNGLDMVNQALASGNVDRAKQIMGQVTAALEEVYALSQKAPTPRVSAPDPQKQKFDTERKQFEDQKLEMFDGGVRADNNAWMTPSVKKEFAAVVKGKAISENLYTRLDEAVRQELGPLLLGNAEFVKQRNALRSKGDRDGVVRLWKQHATPLIPKVVRNVARSFDLLGNVSAQVSGANGKVGKTLNAATGKVEAGFQVVSDFPKPKEVDKLKTTEEMVDRNEFILKTGAKIKVRFK